MSRVQFARRALATALLASFVAAAAAPAALAHHTETSPVRIDALDVSVTVSHHYAVTTVTETLTNPYDTAYEFSATVAAPDLSFVTRFALETGGHVYESHVEETASARAAYDDGTASGSAAAIVESRDTNNFQVSLNIPARTTVVVHLAYEQMVLRVNGEYTYRFPLLATTASHSVGVLTLGASVSGSSPILSASGSHGALTFASQTSFEIASRASYEVPAFDFGFVWTEGLPSGAGTLIAHTDADGTSFVHTFSADGAGLSATPLPKDIVFVIDISGSMDEALPQVKQVFSSIIGDLSPNDRFDVVLFASELWKWSTKLEDATAANTASARAWVDSTDVAGGTDVDLGLAYGISLLPVSSNRAPILVLLSDGEATSGETRPDSIRANLLNRNVAGASIYTLAFGPHSDYNLMQALALENNGEVRRIWLGQDAGDQIRGFYDTISAPLLRGVSVKYGDGAGEESRFPAAFAGSELVTVGHLAPGETSVTVTVTGQGASGPVTYSETFDLAAAEAGAFLERAYAYEQIRALQGRAALGDLDARAQIVSIALAHSFVTAYTSLVVVVPASLQIGGTEAQLPMLLTTVSSPRPSPSTPANGFTSSPPSRATPGPDALLAGAALAACALIAARRRTRA